MGIAPFDDRSLGWFVTINGPAPALGAGRGGVLGRASTGGAGPGGGPVRGSAPAAASAAASDVDRRHRRGRLRLGAFPRLAGSAPAADRSNPRLPFSRRLLGGRHAARKHLREVRHS